MDISLRAGESAATLRWVSGIAVDGAGHLCVADTSSCVVRTISPAGVVSTLVGRPGVFGPVDGVGENVHFFFPAAVAVDRERNV